MSNAEISVNNPCLNCFTRGHTEENCSKPCIYACIKCYRLNVASYRCNCNDHRKAPPPQLLRLVGDHIGPCWYVDVKILGQTIHALINTSIKRCRINQNFASWVQANSTEDIGASEVRVPIRRKTVIYDVRCQVFESQEEALEVGTAFLKYFGYRFTFDGVTISSETSYISSHPNEIEYVYNVPSIGKDLREFLNQKRTFLKKGRVVKLSTWSPKADRIVVVRRTSSESSDGSN